KSGYITNRRPGEVGLGLRIGISSRPPGRRLRQWLRNRPLSSLAPLQTPEDRDRLARSDLNDRLLPAPGAPGGVAAALGLGLDPRGADTDHAHFEQLLDRLADLRLVGVVVHPEG